MSCVPSNSRNPVLRQRPAQPADSEIRGFLMAPRIGFSTGALVYGDFDPAVAGEPARGSRLARRKKWHAALSSCRRDPDDVLAALAECDVAFRGSESPKIKATLDQNLALGFRQRWLRIGPVRVVV